MINHKVLMDLIIQAERNYKIGSVKQQWVVHEYLKNLNLSEIEKSHVEDIIEIVIYISKNKKILKKINRVCSCWC